MYLSYGKRIFDFSLALLCLVIASPIILMAGLSVAVLSGCPVFFVQERVGLQGKRFKLIKFRTMGDASASLGGSTITVAGDKRVTPVGQFLRSKKIDELPQLINVLKGDMSFVGPRPDVPGYADKLTGCDADILLLRPGITGPASLVYRDEEAILSRVQDPTSYNNSVIYPHKVKLNLAYLNDISLLGDIVYIWKTLSGDRSLARQADAKGVALQQEIKA